MKCEVKEVHIDIVEKVQQTMWEEEHVEEVATLFKVMGDPTRLKIMMALQVQPLCVCDLEEIVKMSQSAISHQLRVLKQHQIVTFERKGKNVEYRLHDQHIFDLLKIALAHCKEERK